MTGWRPQANWGIPEIHPHWDRVPGYDFPLSTGRRLVGVDHPAEFADPGLVVPPDLVQPDYHGIVLDEGTSTGKR